MAAYCPKLSDYKNLQSTGSRKANTSFDIALGYFQKYLVNIVMAAKNSRSNMKSLLL